MIIVAGCIYVVSGKRDAFLACSRIAVVAARQTPGCADFIVAADPVEDDRVNVFEMWDSEATLLKFRGSGPGPDLTDMIVRAAVARYHVSKTGAA